MEAAVLRRWWLLVEAVVLRHRCVPDERMVESAGWGKGGGGGCWSLEERHLSGRLRASHSLINCVYLRCDITLLFSLFFASMVLSRYSPQTGFLPHCSCSPPRSADK